MEIDKTAKLKYNRAVADDTHESDSRWKRGAYINMCGCVVKKTKANNQFRK